MAANRKERRKAKARAKKPLARFGVASVRISANDTRATEYRGLEAIGGLPGKRMPKALRWLVDWDRANKHKQGGMKIGALAQIGRIAERHGNDWALRLALRICETAKTSKEAEQTLRSWRQYL
jgi:hypothetical protein